jgi:hypothetical protein
MLGFIQVGFSAPAAVASTLAAPTISSVTTTATSLTVNMQTSGIAASSWRYSLTRRQVSGCATSVTDGAVQSTGSLQSSITITGLTEGCYYTIKVAGFNGTIGSYATVEKLVNGYFNGLKGYHINENTTYEGFTRTPFTTGTCSTEAITSVYKDWSTGGPVGCNTDHFTSYFVGYLRAPVTGAVTFRSANDDGIQLNIQGQNVMFAGTSSASGSINMVQNEIYRIEIWFHEYGGGASFFLDWEYSGQARTQVPSANLASDPSLFFGTCPLGLDARCAAGSALEIKLATGTNMDGQYWININGTPTLVFCVMNSSQGGGGWMLAMRGKNASSTFKYDSALWTNSTLLNENYPQRFTAADTIDTYRNTDAKYAPFSNLLGNQVMVLYPEVDNKAGGAFGTNGSANASGVNSVKYGFAWHETFTAGTPWTTYNSTTKWGGNSAGVAHTNGPAATPACVTTPKTLSNLFNEASRCAFRRVSSNYVSTESPYSAVGDNVFFSQTNIRFFGINYGNASTGFVSKARIGFGWNENGPGNEDSNDGNGGIGLFSTNSTSLAAGTYNGCCSTTVSAADANTAGQNGLSGGDGTTKQLGFELYLRNGSTATISGSNLRVTANRASSMVAGNGFSASGTNGTNTFRLSPVREGFTINSTNGVISVSEGVTIGTYTQTVSVTDTNGVSAARSVTIQVLDDASESDTALSFNGTSEFEATTATISLTGDQTYEAWVKPSSTCSQGTNASFLYTNSFVMFCNGSYWWASFKDSGGNWNGIPTNSRVVANSWVHLAVVRSGTTATFYVNNQQVNVWVSAALANSWSSPSVFATPTTIGIGGTGGGGQYFAGEIDEVKIWSSARTLTQIWNGANTMENLAESSLVAYWDFNEGSGSVAVSRAQRADSTFDFTPTNSQWRSVADTQNSGPYTVVTAPRTLINKVGGWRAPESITAIFALVVGGGGGGGGGFEGGGGGGGGMLESRVSVVPRSIYAIRVGMGGRGASVPLVATRGESSTAFGLDAIGGGSGGNEFDISGSNSQTGPTTGGSGGGGNWGSFMIGASGTVGQGNNGGSSSNLESPTCSPSQYAGAGGGGANGVGGSPSCVKGGNGGAGKVSTLNGSTYGGGGGGSLRSATTFSQRGVGGTGGGGDSSYVSAATVNTTGGASAGSPNTGGGGGAGNSTLGTSGFGGDGGSGVIIFRYITALKPAFTQPTNAFLNVGMTETFTTNVAQDSATAVLTRTFRWESSTTGIGGTFTTIKEGTGAANAFFAWVPPDTATSGNNFLFRIIVTDSDTAGLFIQETSTAVFATINQTLRMAGNSTITKTVGVSKTETFTVTQGTPTYRYTFTNNNTLITLDTSTAGSPRIRLADTITVGTYSETLTLIDSVSATIVQPLTIVVNPPPSFSANGSQVDSGTVLYLDAGNSVSYSGSENTWSDISGRGLTANMTQTFTGTQIAANGSTRTTASMVSNCAAPTYSTDALGSINFNGSSQCAYVANNGVQTSYTVEMWIKRDGPQAAWASTILTTPYRFANDQLNISIFWSDAGTITAGVFQSGGSWKWATGFFVEDRVWTHISVTLSGASLRIMKNSDMATAQTVPTTYTTWNLAIMDNGLLIGQRWGDAGTSGWYKGSLASLRLYSRALTDAEISQNYNATRGRFEGTSNKQRITGKYGTSVNETFTVTAGSETLTAVFTANAIAGLRWDTSTVRSLKVLLQESLTANTYTDTVTVTDIYGSSSRMVITFTVAKADTITVTMDTATVATFNGSPITVFPRPVIRGLVNSDTATVTTKFSSANYTLSASPPTNADTYTVTATDLLMQVGSLDNYLGWRVETSTARINKARQTPLIVSTYTAFIGSPFTITVLGGLGEGAISETLTGVSTAPNCQINNRVLTSSATTTSYCQIRVTRAESQNYLEESMTALVYFIEFVFSQATPTVGSGPNIALTGENDVTVDAEQAPTFSSLSVSSGAVGSSLTINGSGFFYADPTKVEIKFSRSAIATTYTLVSNSVIQVTVPVGASTSRIVITTPRGFAATSTFTVVP